ncbi:MAG TPA: urease accessory protein UreD, partial [Candidatus Competibacteraceae bacterium]|nr:urease accessory protein UreD [Candidatus Competibacteraceae bacterium]
MAQATTQPLSHPSAGWRGELSLRLAARAGRTVLDESRHRGPLMVQRPFHPEPDGGIHLYVLHPPGGLVGGDELRLAAQLAPGARALLTTPSAGKVYRSSGAVASVEHCLHVTDGAALEWLPQELIVYQGARLRALTRVELASAARFIGWEILCLGRPAAGEGFATGCVRLALELWRDGHPLYREHGHYPGGGA